MVSAVPELAQLHDIHLPAPISSWALAPGWYGLMIILSGIAIVVCLRIRRTQAQQRFKKQVLQMLRNIEIDYSHTANSQKTCAAISELLRRVALMCYPRTQVAGLQGDAWLTFLSDTSPASSQKIKQSSIDFTLFRKALLEYPYQPSVPQAQPQIEALFQAVTQWIKNQTLPKTPQGGKDV